MKKVEAPFSTRPDLDIAEHQQYSEIILKDAIEIYETSKGLPPRPWRWPSAAEFRAMAAKEPDPMIAINEMRRRLNPNPFRNLRRKLRTPRVR
jgi:hypothetical protein